MPERPKVAQLEREEVGGIRTQVSLIPKPLFFHDTPRLRRLVEANGGPERGKYSTYADPDLRASCPRFFPKETRRPKAVQLMADSAHRVSLWARRRADHFTHPMSRGLHDAQEETYPVSQTKKKKNLKFSVK